MAPNRGCHGSFPAAYLWEEWFPGRWEDASRAAPESKDELLAQATRIHGLCPLYPSLFLIFFFPPSLSPTSPDMYPNFTDFQYPLQVCIWYNW